MYRVMLWEILSDAPDSPMGLEPLLMAMLMIMIMMDFPDNDNDDEIVCFHC